ncbi:hypothetical protein NBRC10513v2_004061 [Rhodotorula toruloides]
MDTFGDWEYANEVAPFAVAAVAPPTAPTTSSGSPIFVPNLVHNQRALYYVKSTTACIAGSIAGILGLTNLHGFVLFFITSFGVGALYSAVNCGMKPGRYFPKAREPLLSGTLGNCFSFILFWTCAFECSLVAKLRPIS